MVTLILSKLITWMRRQPGSPDLRALLYMDEVFGFAPLQPSRPQKQILTILKQGRAYGVGMLLSTQNPVDLDYKAMSNAGTWMIGRLQTERDKARILRDEVRLRPDGYQALRPADLKPGKAGVRASISQAQRASGIHQPLVDLLSGRTFG